MKIAIVLGTRPEIMKNYAIVHAMRALDMPHLVLHTNQHHDAQMHDTHFALARYQPDVVCPPPYRLGQAIDWVSRLLRQHRITTVLVHGDSAAALIGATAALYTDTPLVHVEAGLRAFDRAMIEERNRIMVDAVAHYLFTNTAYHAAYLRRNTELRGRIVNAGNTTVDLLADFGTQLDDPQIGRYAYLTLHRKEFTDNAACMAATFRALNELASLFDHVIFPMHPRTRDCMCRYAIPAALLSNITVIEPVSFVQSLAYEKHASLIITDSGCMQEEAYLFGVPCVTLRENTERTETVAVGANIVSGFAPDAIRVAVEQQAAKGRLVFPPVYGSVGVGHRIAAMLQYA